ncbi:DUF6542 domain-containing protein [Mycobacterium sp.]|uniref:DUF6542 domain-containing protein n=1 Tax=Mycobacterium sp. TaxID=1785 RepID=UPI00127813D1|nr:DUF6542 domain-containing protein [Mycobacterium sp.]KAA8957414.1 MAG: hypothetical protein F6Q13_16540 [Mycobacterium sp.]
MTASHRSIHPNIPGVPWWAAVVIAVTATVAGFAVDTGSADKELTIVFSACYVAGCVAAVLAVRQSGIFTAVIQPPLILFCLVPSAYWLLRGARISGLKDLLINCGYPLIERFPLMLFTSAGVLLLGMIRWYLGMAASSTGAAHAASERNTGGRINAVVARVASIIGRAGGRSADTGAGKVAARARRSGTGSRAKSAAATRGQPARRAAGAESRRSRPDATRHRRSTRSRDDDPAASRRGRPARDVRRDPDVPRSRTPTRGSRFDPYEPIEFYQRPDPRRRSSPAETMATHHPISQVRYRGATPADWPPPRPPRPPRR